MFGFFRSLIELSCDARSSITVVADDVASMYSHFHLDDTQRLRRLSAFVVGGGQGGGG